MLDLGWSELLIIGVAALIVVGPKDLPRMLRTLGQYAGRARGIAREFQRSMDDAARQADIEELKDVKKGLDDLRDDQYKMQREMGQSFLDGSGKPKPKAPATAAKQPDKAPEKADAPAKPAGAEKPDAKASAAKAGTTEAQPASTEPADREPAKKASGG